MTRHASPSRGRPPAASRETLRDAAFELFLEQGYARTTVEHITRRAGVSRNTFFNYFDAKGDVFWVEVDEALTRLETVLGEPATASDPHRAGNSLRRVAEAVGPDAVPFVLTQASLIGSTAEVQATAVPRVTRAANILTAELLSQQISEADARAQAYAIVGAATSAIQSWAAAGTTRGTLARHLERAFAALGPSFLLG